MTAPATTRDRFVGCLLGGAAGDALGAPVEFLSLGEIHEGFGPEGITDLAEAYGRVGAITDDTQMTLFTAEGLIRAHNRGRSKGVVNISGVVHRAYLRWLDTQGDQTRFPHRSDPHDGWLVSIPELRARRAPGNTCLSALRGDRAGSVEEPLNNSKGCGGVMRIAPVGLAWWGRPETAFARGSEIASLTHGHPAGYLAAGFLAATVAGVAGGADPPDATTTAKRLLAEQPAHEATLAAVERAQEASLEGALAAHVESLGQGWVAEEALAIALYCVLATESLEDAVLLAVNHSGDSDSTGAIAGNLAGAIHGSGAIPARWLEALELRDVVERIAEDLWRYFAPDGEPVDEAEDDARYPAW